MQQSSIGGPAARWMMLVVVVVGLVTLTISVSGADDTPSAAPSAAQIVRDLSGLAGGVVVTLGGGDARLAAALGADTRCTVQALGADAPHVQAARRQLREGGDYGRISSGWWAGERLPYVDNLVNLVVVEDLQWNVEPTELLRVLAPEGCLCFRAAWTRAAEVISEPAVGGEAVQCRVRGAAGRYSWARCGEWRCVRKPRPAGIDAWTHFLHGPGNNAVANDVQVGQPRGLQWVASPLWLRSHETPSGIQAPVSDGRRVYYFLDEGPIGITDERLPDHWALVCRDAFNGRQLWRRPLGAWGWRQWAYARFAGQDWTTLRAARTNVPDENQRRIVAVDQHVYTTLDYQGPVVVLDAASGRTLAEVAGSAGTSEILVASDLGLAYVNRATADQARRGRSRPEDGELIAFDLHSAEVRWRQTCGTLRPLMLALDNGRVIYLAGKALTALSLRDGSRLWSVEPRWAAPKTLVAVDDVILLQGGARVLALDAANGAELWNKTGLPAIPGGEGDDLFVIDGLVWRGMMYATEQGEPSKSKSPNAVVVGWDLRSGAERDRIHVNNLRSPEHHHRCYRNKATTRYLISSYEGAEYLDLQADDHGMNNFVRGSCRSGMLPCNGMLYVPADQCFCQPGAKLLGFAAVKRDTAATEPLPDVERLVRGPAYGQVDPGTALPGDWPTFRGNPQRGGATPLDVAADLSVKWKTALGGALTAPVVADGRLFVARRDAQTLYAVDVDQGRELWSFVAGGRIDSPPTCYRGLVLFGSADGQVYCLRAADGELVWQFLAAPVDLRLGAFEQLESVWPVHGSVLIEDGVAYCTAGRSTYLDGGVHVYGLQPDTGQILYRTVLAGPHRSVDGPRDMAFFLPGANSDVLVGEDEFIYMRQKKLTRQLEELPVEVLSTKGEADVGRHVFSTAGLLDDSWYNRTFWMYSRRWPGFQLVNQAPKSGQLLVVDDQRTYAVRVFYRRNVHSPMFFPAREGYLVFADHNDNEPQIVGEPGARPPLAWLPQSDYSRATKDGAVRKLDSEAFGLDKMIGYTRAEPTVWQTWLPVRVRGMVKAGATLFVAGAPDVLDPQDPLAALEGRQGASLVALSAADGSQLGELPLDAPPVFDGLIAAAAGLFVCQCDGTVVCLRP